MTHHTTSGTSATGSDFGIVGTEQDAESQLWDC